MDQKRIPVLLDEEDYEKLRKLAFDTRLPMAEHVRQALREYLRKTHPGKQITAR